MAQIVKWTLSKIAAAGLLLALGALAVWFAAGDSPAQAVGLSVGVDVNPTATPANTKTSLGTLQTCRDVGVGANFTVDIYITDVTPNLIAFDTVLDFDAAVLSVTSVDVQQFLSALPNSEVSDYSGPVSTGLHRASGADTNQGSAAAESGSGVLARFSLQAIAAGTSRTNVVRLPEYSSPVLTDNNATHLGDTSIPPDGVYDGVIVNGTIAVAQADLDGDTISNVCDPDDDGDGDNDTVDNCPINSNPGQENMDGDALGDVCDVDKDGDGFYNQTEIDKGSNQASATSTVEVCDNPPLDNDGDTQTNEGYDKNGDTLPDCTQAIDSDGDTTPNTTDTDDDGDGASDSRENKAGTDALDKCSDNISNPWGAPQDDAWMWDIDNNHLVNVTDVLKFKPVMLSALGDTKFNRRLDFNSNSVINVLDVLLIRPFILTICE